MGTTESLRNSGERRAPRGSCNIFLLVQQPHVFIVYLHDTVAVFCIVFFTGTNDEDNDVVRKVSEDTLNDCKRLMSHKQR